MEYLKEFGDIYKRPEKRLEPVLVNQEQWRRDKTYLWHEDRIVLPSDRIRRSSSATMSPVVMWGPAVPWGFSSSVSTLRGLMTSCGKPSSLSWTSARVGPVNLGISGTEVSNRLSLSPTVPTVFSTWSTPRCLSSGGMILP